MARTRTKAQPNATLDEARTEPKNGVAVPVTIEPAALPANLAPEAAAFLSMIERASRDPAVDIAKMEKLLELRNQERAYNARMEFDAAMADAQAEMDPVRKNAPSDKGKYASYDALDNAIRDIYSKHGFAISYNTAESRIAEHVIVLARASHRGGHREEYRLDMPADGKGARGNDVMTKTHATGSAFTYGKRYLLAGIFNIAVTNDDDGKGAGYKAPAGSASGGSDFRGHSSANGRRMAADDPHLISDRKKNEPAAPSFTPPADATVWTNNAISTLNLADQTEAKLKEFAAQQGQIIGWIKANDDTQYQRIRTAYGNALEAARAKMQSTQSTPTATAPKPTVTDVADQNDLPPEHARPGHPLTFTPFDKNSEFMNFCEDFLPKTNPPGARQFLDFYEAKLKGMEANTNAAVQEAAGWVRATAAEIINPPDSAKA